MERPLHDVAVSSGVSPSQRCERRTLSLSKIRSLAKLVVGRVDGRPLQSVDAATAYGRVEIPIEVDGASGVGTTAQPTDRESRRSSLFFVAHRVSDSCFAALRVDLGARPAPVATQTCAMLGVTATTKCFESSRRSPMPMHGAWPRLHAQALLFVARRVSDSCLATLGVDSVRNRDHTQTERHPVKHFLS